MLVKPIRREGNQLELLLEDVDMSLLQILQLELLSDDKVEFAAYRRSHPLERKYFLVVRAKDGAPKDALLRALKRARERTSALLGALSAGLGVN
ncbi:MAG: RpoL/Rpb11 RNA polymerase subunit family protein [Nitrososphaeria archaeon]